MRSNVEWWLQETGGETEEVTSPVPASAPATETLEDQELPSVRSAAKG